VNARISPRDGDLRATFQRFVALVLKFEFMLSRMAVYPAGGSEGGKLPKCVGAVE